MKAPPLAAPLDNDQRWILVWAPDLQELLRRVLQGNPEAIETAERITSYLPPDSVIGKQILEWGDVTKPEEEPDAREG